MSDTWRLFIAIGLSPELHQRLLPLREALVTARERQGGGLSIPPLANLHLTLQFLGDTPASLVPVIDRHLNLALSGCAAFTVPVRGVGAFPQLNRPRIIWAGLSSSEKLTSLHRHVIDGLDGLPLRLDRKPFKPHLTLARVKQTHGHHIQDALKPYLSEDFGVLKVESVRLYRSELHQSGAVYTPLATWRLE